MTDEKQRPVKTGPVIAACHMHARYAEGSNHNNRGENKSEPVYAIEFKSYVTGDAQGTGIRKRMSQSVIAAGQSRIAFSHT